MRRACILAVLAALAPVAAASASTVTYFLNQSNTTPPFPDGTDYLRLTITDGADAAGVSLGSYTTTAADVVFRVDVLPSLSVYQASGFGLDQFAFNSALPTNPTSSNFVLPSGWSLAGPGNADGFGMFELRPDTNGAGNRLASLVFGIKNFSGDNALSYFDLSGGNAGQGNYAYAAHVAGLAAPGGVSSAWFAGPTAIPLPGTLPLLLTTLSALGIFVGRAKGSLDEARFGRRSAAFGE